MNKHKNLPFRCKNERDVKFAHLYKFIKYKGTFKKLFKRVPISNFKDYLSSSFTTFVGFTPNYIGTTFSRGVTAKSIYLSSFNKNMSYIKKIFPNYYEKTINVLSKYRKSYSPGINTSFGHLLSYSDDTRPLLTFEELLLPLIHSKFSWFTAPKVEFRNKEEVFHCTNFNPNASPGIITRIMFGNKRSKTISKTTLVAMEMFEYLRIRPFKNWSLWEILGREKDVSNDNCSNLEEVSTRVVLNTEEHHMILLSLFGQKLSIPIIKDKNSNCVIGRRYDLSKNTRILNNKYKYDYYVSTDWSSFDSTCYSSLILLSVLVLCSNLPNDKFHRRVVYYISSSLITKFIAVPPGVVFRLENGIPSGHPFTSIITSYCNLILWSYIGFKIYGPNYAENMDVVVCGDDANVFFNKNENLQYIDDFIKETGMISEPIYDSITPCKSPIDRDESPDFLKRIIDYDGVTWNTEKIIQKLVYLSKNRSIDLQIDVIENFIITAPFDDDFNEFLLFVMKDYCSEGRILTIRDSIRKKKLEYNKLDDSLEGFNYEKNVMNIQSIDSRKQKSYFSVAKMETMIYDSFPVQLYFKNIDKIRKLKFDEPEYIKIRNFNMFSVVSLE